MTYFRWEFVYLQNDYNMLVHLSPHGVLCFLGEKYTKYCTSERKRIWEREISQWFRLNDTRTYNINSSFHCCLYDVAIL